MRTPIFAIAWWVRGFLVLIALGASSAMDCHANDASNGPPQQAADQREPASDLEPIVQVGHTGHLKDIVFSANKKYFLTTARDLPGRDQRDVILWDAVLGDRLRTFSCDRFGLPPAFCLDDRAILVGKTVWDVESGKRRQAILDDADIPTAACISNDSRRAIFATKAGSVLVADLETGKTSVSFVKLYPEEETADGSEDRTGIAAVAFTKEGAPVALVANHAPPVGNSGRASVWNVATKEKLGQFAFGEADSLRFAPGADYVVSRRWEDTGSSDERTIIYNPRTGKILVDAYEWFGDQWQDDLDSVRFTSDGNFCVTGSNQRRATLWDLRTGRAVRHFDGHVEPIRELRLLDLERVLETRSRELAQRWELKTGKLLQVFRDPRYLDTGNREYGKPARVVPSPDGKLFFCNGVLFDAETNEPRHELLPPNVEPERDPPHRNACQRVFFTLDGRLVIVVYGGSLWQGDQTVLFDVASGKALRQLARFFPSRNQLQWSPDGRRALTKCDGVYRLWDVEKGQVLQHIGVAGNRAFNVSFSFSPNGRYLYTHGRHYGVFCWDAETGNARHHDPPGEAAPDKRSLFDVHKHHDYFNGCSAVSADRRTLVSWYPGPADRKHAIEVWDADKGDVSCRLDHSDDDDLKLPLRPVLSPTGRFLMVVSRGYAEKMVAWDLASCTKRYDLPGMGGWRQVVLFTPDGQKMLIGHRQGTSLYDAATGRLVRHITSRTLWESEPPPLSVFVSPDNRYLVAAESAEKAVVWNLETSEPIRTVRREDLGPSATRHFCFSDDGRSLLVSARPARVVDLESGKISDVDPPERELYPRGFSPPGSRKVGPSADPTPVPDDILERFENRIPTNAQAVEWTADHRRLIVYQADGGMAVWDIASGEPVYRCYQFDQGRQWLTVMPDGRCHGDLEFVRYGKMEE